MDLIIVESPSKAKTISKYLKGKYKVDASAGHIRDLPVHTLGVDIKNNFEPKYVNSEGKEDIIRRLTDETKKADNVYLATDPDREGEAISWHLQTVLGLDENKENRIEFNEISPKAVEAALEHPRTIDYNLVDAQQARRACGEQQLLRTQRIAYARQPPFGEPAGEKRPVVGAVHPFERHALHGIARAHDPALDGIGRRPLHAVDGAQQRLEPSSRRDGPRLRGVDPGAVDHLDRRRKAHHAGRHFAFETEDPGQRHEHHGHRYGHRNHGDARHHPGPVLRRGAGGAARYEKFEVQTTAILTVKFHAK